MAFTATCTTEMCEVSAGLNGYTNLNAVVYGISGDNPFAQEAWAQKEKITVPLLSDYEHKIAKEYGVMYDSFLPQMNLGMSGVPKRSAFIIDKNGVIQYVESNDDARQLAKFREDQNAKQWRSGNCQISVKIKAKLEDRGYLTSRTPRSRTALEQPRGLVSLCPSLGRCTITA